MKILSILGGTEYRICLGNIQMTVSRTLLRYGSLGLGKRTQRKALSLPPDLNLVLRV